MPINDTMRDRRGFMATLAYGFGAAGLATVALAGRGRATEAGAFPATMTDADWKKKLTPMQYRVLRQEGTERAYTSALNDQHGKGVFACAGCAKKLFESRTKFDSGTGWPSFYEPIKDAVGEHRDATLGFVRTEVHCSNCGGHLGHVFDDGPKPTGLRYCMNGVAMTFLPATGSA